MKTHSLFLLLLILSFALVPPTSHGADTVVSADDILNRIAPLSRSIKSPPKDTRIGYVISGNDSTRSLAAVEVDVQADASISLPNINFKLNSAELADFTSRAQLEELAKALLSLPAGSASFLIEGHTCPRGTDEVNNRLSAERAAAVQQFLLDRKVPAEMIQAIGLGAAEARKDKVSEASGEAVLSLYRKVMIFKKL